MKIKQNFKYLHKYSGRVFDTYFNNNNNKKCAAVKVKIRVGVGNFEKKYSPRFLKFDLVAKSWYADCFYKHFLPEAQNTLFIFFSFI